MIYPTNMGLALITISLLLLVQPAISASDGQDFSNNLFSDLGPLLQLFGEQVAKQFMSQSVGWADNILFAMAPLGIITAVVGAIRVSGPTWLKAIIGRARENRAAAEVELMSSTSHEVSELWNGQALVRTMGSPPIHEILYFPEDSSDMDPEERERSLGFYTLEEAKEMGYLKPGKYHDGRWDSKLAKAVRGDSSDEERGDDTKSPKSPASAPNIFINLQPRRSRNEVYTIAGIGVALQLSVLVFSGLSTYYSPWKLDDQQATNYAYPLTALGTLILASGMLICSFVIERSTLETDWQVNTPDGVRIAWLQKRGVVNDQLFDSYAIFANGLHKSVLTSRRIEASSLPSHQIPDFPKLVVVATVISVVGFIVQFTGLRGMHWSAAVMQLAATIIMACLRAWVRRDLSLRPVALAIPTEHEIDWFSTRLAMDRGWPYNDKEEPRGYDIWSIMSGGDVTGYFTDFSRRDDTSMTDAQTVMRVRERLGDLCDWAGPTSDVAVSVANSVEEVMNTLFADRSGDFVWNLKAVTGSSPLEESIQFTVRKSEKRWVAKAAEIDAALSLWLFTLRKQEDIEQQRQNNGDQKDEGDRLRHGATAVRKPCMRLLCDSTRETHLSLSWWIPDGTAQIVEVEQPKTSQAGSSTDVLEFEKCRIIGSPECTAAHAPSHEPIKFRSRTLDELAQEASDGDIKRAEESDESENPGTPVRRLAIVSDRSLEVVLGQHLFSAFMFAVADHTERPAGDTTVQDASLGSTSGSEQGQTSSKLENSILSRIARRVETFGLGNVQEVYACMIPPLCLKRKLPTALPVVDLVRRLARPHEVVGHWDLAGNMYRRLFKVASMFNPHDIVALRATVLYADFLKQVTAAAEYCDDLCLWEAEKLKTIKTAALDDLKTIDRDIVLPLAWMYRIQGRLKGLEDFMVLRDGENITQHLLPKSLGHTPLHEHAVSGDPCRRIAWLIRMGVPVDAKDILEWTPLHHAAAGGDEKSVTTLLEEGANLNSRDIAEWTPLHYAALNHAGEPAAQQFLHRGAEADTKGRDGIGPLHCAAMRNNERVARLLIESGANVEIQDNFKRTPLHWAAYRGAFPVVQLLLTKGAYLHAREMNGCTALHLAAVQGHKEVVSLLVDKKADLKARSRNGRTALVMAASGGDQVVAGVLVVEGADVHANDTEKRTALHVAAAHGHEEVARVLIVDGKADANAKDIDGWTPLHMASSEGVARVLVVEGKADVNARNEHGETPLHQAAERGNEAVARVLVLDGKANISAVNNFGGTALTMAEVKGHDAIVRLLQP